MDIDAVRTFLAVAAAGQGQAAADDLRLTQQGVSRRLRRLEDELGVELFVRGPRGSSLTVDGQAFMPHAEEVVRTHDRAMDSVQKTRRPMRIDVLNYRTAPADLLRRFHDAAPQEQIEAITLPNAKGSEAFQALLTHDIDATFRYVPDSSRLPSQLEAVRAIHDPHQLLVGPKHPLARRRSLEMNELQGRRIWIPGIRPGTEWHTFYAELSETHGLTIEPLGPNFGTEHLLDVIAESADLSSLVGQHTRLIWPSHYRLRRIPLTPPTPYPHFLVHRRDDTRPQLAALKSFIERDLPLA